MAFHTDFRFVDYVDGKGERKPNPEPELIYGPVYSVGPLTVCAYAVETADGLVVVGPAVEAGFADQQARRSTELLGKFLNPRAKLPDLAGIDRSLTADAGRRAVLSEHFAQSVGPFPGGHAGVSAANGGGHDVAVGLCCIPQGV